MTKASGGNLIDGETEGVVAPEVTDRPFVFDMAKVEGRTNEELLGGAEQAEALLDLFGRDLVTRTLVHSKNLYLSHHVAPPGLAVKPHRHGTHQASYVLRGELIYGNQRVGPGMGYFSPDRLYAWRVGDEGAEWIEVHAGQPGIYTDPPEGDA